MNNNNLTINSVEELRTRLDEMAAEFAGQISVLQKAKLLIPHTEMLSSSICTQD